MLGADVSRSLPGRIEQPRQVHEVAGADKDVHLGDALPQRRPKALGEASGHDEPARAARLLVAGEVEDRVDRLLLRLVDKGAGVDHQHVGLGGIHHQSMPVAHEQALHHLAVDEVLRAAEREEVDPLAGGDRGARFRHQSRIFVNWSGRL